MIKTYFYSNVITCVSFDLYFLSPVRLWDSLCSLCLADQEQRLWPKRFKASWRLKEKPTWFLTVAVSFLVSTFQSTFLTLEMIVTLQNVKIHLLLRQKYCSFMCFSFIPRTGRLPFIDAGTNTDFETVTTTKKKRQWQRPRESNREKTNWQADRVWASGENH